MQKKIGDLLSITNNFTLKGITVQGAESIIHCEWKRKAHICPQGGSKVRHLHQNHGRKRLLHEIKSDGKRIYLDVPNLRYRYSSCGRIFTLRSKATFPWSRVTAHMLICICDKLRKLSFKEVATWAGMSHQTLHIYAKRFLENELDWNIFKGQDKIRLGIDEHSISGRRKMALLVVELISSTPVAVLESHRKEGYQKRYAFPCKG